MSATKRVLELNRRRYRARERLMAAMRPLGDGIVGAWKLVLQLERAATLCGEERQRRRTP